MLLQKSETNFLLNFKKKEIWVLDFKKDWDKIVVSEMYSNIYVVSC